MIQSVVSKYLLPVISLFLSIVLMSCPASITDIWPQIIDTVPPEIIVITPVEGDSCSNIVEATGFLNDFSSVENDIGKISNLYFRLSNSNESTDVPLHPDNSFRFYFTTDTIQTEKFILYLTALDWNNNKTTKSLSLSKTTENTIPSFKIESGNRQIELKWAPVPETESYTLLYTMDGTLPSRNNGEQINDIASPYTMENLTNGTLYILKLLAQPTSGLPESSSGFEKAIPLSPRTLAPEVTCGEMIIKVEWPSVPGAESYSVLRAEHPDGQYINISGSIVNTAYIDSNVIKGRNYYYSIKPSLAGCLKSQSTPGQLSCSILSPLKINGIIDADEKFSDIYINDTFLYAIDGLLLRKFDIGNPNSIREISSSFIPLASELIISKGYLFLITEQRGFEIFNLENTYQPVYTHDQVVHDMFKIGDTLYIYNGTPSEIWLQGFQVLDISDPQKPEVLGYVSYPQNILTLCVEENTAYVVSENTESCSLNIIDMSVVSNPVVIGECPLPENINTISMKNTYLFISDWRAQLHIIDVSDRSNPFKTKTMHLPVNIFKSTVQENFLFLLNSERDVNIFDISIPEFPVQIGSCSSSGYAYNMEIKNDFIFISDGQAGIQIIDYSGIRDSFHPYSLQISEPITDILIHDHTAYCGTRSSSIIIADISIPQSPDIVNICGIPGDIENMKIVGLTLYVSCGEAGLLLFDISTPHIPVLINIHNTPGNAKNVSFKNDTVFIADGESGIYITDGSNPEALVNISYCETYGYANDLVVRGNNIYTADGIAGFQVIDISDIKNPQLKGNCSTKNPARYISQKDDYVFVTGTLSHQIFNIKNPLNPLLLYTMDFTDTIRNCLLRDRYLFLMDENFGFYIFNILNSEKPEFIKFIRTEHPVNDIDIQGVYMFAAMESNGVLIVNLSPESP